MRPDSTSSSRAARRTIVRARGAACVCADLACVGSVCVDWNHAVRALGAAQKTSPRTKVRRVPSLFIGSPR